jgi:hypothetical protein
LFALACALSFVVGFNGIILNPWWGLHPAQVRGAPLMNELVFAYAAPAVGLVLYGWLRSRQGLLLRANAASSIGLALGLEWLTLELRRLFHASNMAADPIHFAEGWAMTLLWLAFAGGLLWLGRTRDSGGLRIAALLLALAVLVKAGVFDAASLSGPLRALALALLTAFSIGLILLYFRRFLPEAASVKFQLRLSARR